MWRMINSHLGPRGPKQMFTVDSLIFFANFRRVYSANIKCNNHAAHLS